LESFFAATKYDKNWYKAWHSWALANFEVVAQNEINGTTTKNLLTENVAPAIKAFFKSIALSAGNSLQDTLRLLTLWFKYGSHEVFIFYLFIFIYLFSFSNFSIN